MKNLKIITVLFMGIFLIGAIEISFAQEVKREGKNYAVLISQPNHLKAALHTAETLFSTDDFKAEKFVIMACGKAVQAFVKSGDFDKQVEKMKTHPIEYKVCGLSLVQMGLDEDEISDHAGIVPNGLTHMFLLKKEGYETLEL